MVNVVKLISLVLAAILVSPSLLPAAASTSRHYELTIPPPMLNCSGGDWSAAVQGRRPAASSGPGPGLTLVIGDVDALVRQHMAALGHEDSRFLAFLSGLFDPRRSTIAALALLALGPASGAAVHWSKATLTAAALSVPLKAATGMARPTLDEGPTYRGPTLRQEYWSAPSGHTAMAAAAAGVAATHWPNFTLPAYTVAAAVGLGRMLQDQHWLSNILLGFALGKTAAGITGP